MGNLATGNILRDWIKQKKPSSPCGCDHSGGGSYDDTDLKNRITELENKSDNDTIYDDTELKDRITTLENRPDNDTIYDDSTIIARIEALENKTDNDTIYDDTKIKNEITGIKNQISALSTQGYDDSAIIARIQTLESKTDNDTIYDDSVLSARVTALENAPSSSYDDSAIIARIQALENNSPGQINYIKSSPLTSDFKGIRSTVDPSDDPNIIGSLDYGFIWFNILSRTYFIYKGIDPNTNKIIWEQVGLNQKTFDEISITLGTSVGFGLGQARLVDVNGNEYFEPSDSEVTPFGTYPTRTNFQAGRYFVIDGEKYDFSISYVGSQPYRSNNVWCYLSPFNPNQSLSVALTTASSSTYTAFNGTSTNIWSECKIKFTSPLPSKIIGIRFSSMFGSSSVKSLFGQSPNFAEIRFKSNDIILAGLGWENISVSQATQNAVSAINNTTTSQNRLLLGANIDYTDLSVYTDNSSAASVISENRAYLS